MHLFSLQYFIYLSITPTRNKEKNKEFFCLHSITCTSRKRMLYSFSTSYDTKNPTKQSRYLQVSFLEGSAVIDEGDYQLFKQALFHPRFSCVSHKYLRISKSRQQSSRITFLCQKFAVINEEGDYS